MSDLRDALERLAGGWSRKVELFRKHHAEDDSFIWLLACLAEVEEILASHPVSSPSPEAPRSRCNCTYRATLDGPCIHEAVRAPSPVQGEAPRCACGDPECRAKGVWWCNTCTEPMGPACGSHDVAWRPAVQGAETGKEPTT